MSASKVSGQIVDRQSKTGVVGALVIVLKPNVTTAEFIEKQQRDMALSSVRSGGGGEFELPDPLPAGQTYSLIVVARRYVDKVMEGAVRIGADAQPETRLTPIRLDRE
ncbi:MAG: hypothetical protein R3C44_01840 [Chloroflexota bacterium]